MDQLTSRENEIAALAAAGLPAKEIADRLGIARGTAKRHLRNIYAKLGIHSQVKLALTWMKHQQGT
jgi:DNA-binding CsgD family transcriptional regulator